MNSIGDEMYYRTGREMRKSNGTVAGTMLIREMPTSTLKRGGQFVELDGRAYFDLGYRNTSGVWSTDGTDEGTRFEGTGTDGSGGWLESMIEFDGGLFYIAEGENSGDELWRFTPEPPVQGDVNGDRVVDKYDFRILEDNFGANAAKASEGDLNGDNLVDFRDFLILAQSWQDN